MHNTLGQFKAVKFLYSCFESWALVIYNLKQVARKLLAREQYEEVLLNKGVGKNGKGVAKPGGSRGTSTNAFASGCVAFACCHDRHNPAAAGGGQCFLRLCAPEFGVWSRVFWAGSWYQTTQHVF